MSEQIEPRPKPKSPSPCSAWDSEPGQYGKCRHGHIVLASACRTGSVYPYGLGPSCVREDLPFDEVRRVIYSPISERAGVGKNDK